MKNFKCMKMVGKPYTEIHISITWTNSCYIAVTRVFPSFFAGVILITEIMSFTPYPFSLCLLKSVYFPYHLTKLNNLLVLSKI